MAKLSETFKKTRFRLRVKQHALVLEYTTAIQDAMNAGDITQSDLAKRLRKSRSWVSKIFRKQPNLTFFTAVEVANALDLDVELRAIPRDHAATIPSATNVILFRNPASLPIPASNEPVAHGTATIELRLQA